MTTAGTTSDGPSRSFSFPKSRKLLTGKQFDTVFLARTSVGDGMLVMHVRPNNRGEARLGMAVSKKVGNAVRRNRWKRLLREAFRLAQHGLPPLDIVCLPRFRGEPSLPAITASLLDLAQRAQRKAAKKQAEKVGKREAPKQDPS